MIADITPKYNARSNVLKEIELKFLKSTHMDHHQIFKNKIQLLRENSPPNKFRVKKTSRSQVKSSIHKRYKDQEPAFDDFMSTEFVSQPLIDDRKTTSALNVYPSQTYSKESQKDPHLYHMKVKSFTLKDLTFDNPRFSTNKVSIVNKSNLFLIPFLKNKLRELSNDTNCPHIADIPMVHSLTNHVQKRVLPVKTHQSRNRNSRQCVQSDPKDDFGPW